jgi:hypothetical protein
MPVQLSDQEKIDRAAFHEEVRFYKKQQWAVTTAGVALLGALLATVRGEHLGLCEKSFAVFFIVAGVCAGGYFLDDLQSALARVRRRLDPSDPAGLVSRWPCWQHFLTVVRRRPDATTRGLDIVCLHKGILVVSAVVVLWALFKDP